MTTPFSSQGLDQPYFLGSLRLHVRVEPKWWLGQVAHWDAWRVGVVNRLGTLDEGVY